MTRYYDLGEANEQLAQLETILLTLAQQRVQLIRLRDRVLASEGPGATGGDERVALAVAPDADGAVSDELRLARLRMQGLIDQMQAGVARIDELGVVLRDIETGLVDFPCLVAGRQVWLCWHVGEPEVAWWHELDSGVAGRRRIADLS